MLAASNFLLVICGVISYVETLTIFWDFKGSNKTCVNSTGLLKLMVDLPENCYQENHGDKTKISLKSCIENIKCTKKKNKQPNVKEIPHCSNKRAIVCCMSETDCSQKKKKNEEEEEIECRQVGNKLPLPGGANQPLGGKCKFPFKFEGKTYHNCTTHLKNCLRWCPTLLTDDNEFVDDSNLWGWCDLNCPFDKTSGKSKTCSRISPFAREREITRIKRPPRKPDQSCGTINTTTWVESLNKTMTLYEPAECLFPFFYNEKWHNTCIADDDQKGAWWCSVKNDHGFHRPWGSKWKYCNSDCPVQIGVHENDIHGGKVQVHYKEDEYANVRYEEFEDENFDYEVEKHKDSYENYDIYEEGEF